MNDWYAKTTKENFLIDKDFVYRQSVGKVKKEWITKTY